MRFRWRASLQSVIGHASPACAIGPGREPVVPGISYADHKKLSPHAQHLTRFSVIDSSEQLPQGYVMRPMPKALAKD